MTTPSHGARATSSLSEHGPDGTSLARSIAAAHLSRRQALRAGLLGVGSVGAAALVAACSNGTEAAPVAGGASGKAKDGGVLIIARAQDSVSMDKTTVFSNASIWVFHQIFETLTNGTPDGKDVEPGLATKWTQSADKLTWAFTLRPGVTFSDGTPVSAADWKFSIDEASGTDGGWEYINAAIDSVTATDDSTLTITTKYPWAPLLADLALFNNAVIPEDYGGRSKDEFYAAPVGTGPFVWDVWDKGSKLTLKKNTKYWREGLPHLDSVTWQVVPDDNTRNVMVQGGQAQVNENPPLSTVAQLEAAQGVDIELFPSTRTDYVLLNTTKGPYADVHVRRAVSHAIDRVALVKTVLFDHGTVANSFLMPSTPFYDEAVKGLDYDMAAAKAEMAQSGFADGFETVFLASSGDASDAAIAQILQASLKQLGITMTIENADPSAVHDQQTALDYEISHSYWTMDIADPDELVQFAVIPDSGGKSFYTGYTSDKAAQLATDAEKTFAEADRQKLYTELQQLVADDAPLLPLFYQPFPYAIRSDVKGFFVAPTGLYDLAKTSMA